ncbi:MAG: DUF3429 domain-containing protein [Casimicrobiaceae bacterium]
MDPCARLARRLGYAGLIPFLFLALGRQAFPDIFEENFTIAALAFYAAIIVSFMAGLQWAYAIAAPSLGDRARKGLLIASVVPPVAAWILLGQLGLRNFLLAAALCLIATAAIDAWLRRQAWFPPWFWRLRVQLTTVAVACLVIAYF